MAKGKEETQSGNGKKSTRAFLEVERSLDGALVACARLSQLKVARLLLECGASPHWNCGACMQKIRGKGANCSDPTYPSNADLELNPTCMAQFNGTRVGLDEVITAQDSENVNSLQHKQKRRNAAAAIREEIAALHSSPCCRSAGVAARGRTRRPRGTAARGASPRAAPACGPNSA